MNVAGINKDALFHMVTMEQLRLTFQINSFSQIVFSQVHYAYHAASQEGQRNQHREHHRIDLNPGQSPPMPRPKRR